MKRILKKLLELFSSGREINFAKQRMLERIIRPLARERATLEIGCSIGETYAGGDGGVYIGLDIGLEYLEQFRYNPGCGAVRLVQADAARMPFSDNSYGFVYTITTLELLDRDKVRTILSECIRVGGRDAKFIFQFFNPRSIQYAFTRDSNWRGEVRYSYYTLTLSASRRLLTELGFAIESEFHYVLIPYFVVNKLGWRWLAELDFLLSSATPGFAGKNMFVCRHADPVQ